MACLRGGRDGSVFVSGSRLEAGLYAGGICPAGEFAMTRAILLLLAGAALAWPQDLAEVLKQGEQVFAKSCATGYCHGVRGGPGGAPRLVGRHFDQTYISNVVARGVP